MLGLYYRIWVDLIIRARSRPANKQNWPRGTMFFMSISMAFNLLLLMVVLQQYVLGYFLYSINLNYLPRQLDYLFNFIILFFMPCIAVNYFFIFRNRRYDKLLKKYPYYNGKLFGTYFVSSMLVPIILVWIFE